MQRQVTTASEWKQLILSRCRQEGDHLVYTPTRKVKNDLLNIGVPTSIDPRLHDVSVAAALWFCRNGSWPEFALYRTCDHELCVSLCHRKKVKHGQRRKPPRDLNRYIVEFPPRRGQAEDDGCWEWIGPQTIRPLGVSTRNSTPKRALWMTHHGQQMGRWALDPRPNCHPMCVRPEHMTPRLMLTAAKSKSAELRKLLRDYCLDGLDETPRLASVSLCVGEGAMDEACPSATTSRMAS